MGMVETHLSSQEARARTLKNRVRVDIVNGILANKRQQFGVIGV